MYTIPVNQEPRYSAGSLLRVAVLCSVPLVTLPVDGVTVQSVTVEAPSTAGKLQQSSTPKLGHDLAALAQEYSAFKAQTQGVQALGKFSPRNSVLPVADGYVTIDAVASGDPEALRTELEKLGLRQGSTFGKVVSGRFPITRLNDLQSLESLQFVRPAYAAKHKGSATTQGDVSMRADVARSVTGVTGSGTTVGALSDSYNCLGGAAAGVASGDLPAGVKVLDDTACAGGNASDEGRAMLELIHDVAPGAALAFHTAHNGQASFAQGILDLKDAGAKVIVDDAGYATEPMFQDGIIAQAANQVQAAGVAYFSSAGNSSRVSYEAPFTPAGIQVDYGREVTCEAHDFDPGPAVDIFQHITLPEGYPLFLSFQWNQPFFSVSGAPGSTSDLDILLVNEAGTIAFEGGIDQNAGGDPVEVMTYVNPPRSGVTGFNILITKCSGSSPNLAKYVELQGTIGINEFATASGTSFGHPNAAGAIGVGAAFYGQTPEFGTSPPVVESFSSAGGIPILFDTNGNPLAQPEVRNKPDIVAPDGVDTTFFGSPDVDGSGFPNFFGTSAAAPHAAAVAALMLEANPAVTPAEISTTLQNTALDMDDPGTAGFDPGFDFATGHGLIQADAALGLTQPPASGADLSITATDLQDPVQVRGDLYYQAVVTNNGPAEARKIRFRAGWSSKVKIVAVSTTQGVCTSKILRRDRSCRLGKLDSGESITVLIRVKPKRAGTLVHTASVASKVADPNMANNTATAGTTVLRP